MLKVRLNLRNVVKTVACLAMSVLFLSCDENTDNNDDNNTGNGKKVAVTKVTIETPASATLAIGGTLPLKATVEPDNATDKTVTWSTDKKEIATVNATTGVVTAVSAGKANIIVTTKDGGKTDKCEVTVSATSETGVVINGVKWATRNVDKPGTFAATPESVGMFYQWNRKVAYPTTGNITNWDNTVPEGDEPWLKANDPSPSGWRVPFVVEFEALLKQDKVEQEWITQKGVNGRKFTDKATGKSIFLPAVGYLDYNLSFNAAGVSGNYWGSTPYGRYNACRLFFISDYTYWVYGEFARINGLSVRPVAE